MRRSEVHRRSASVDAVGVARPWFALLAWLALAPGAHANEPGHLTLRMATSAPEGTAWAHELHRFSDEVSQSTGGTLQTKWFLGGIAGNELQMEERVRRGQLDGVGSGGMICQHLAPAMAVLRISGLFRNRNELDYITGQLASTLRDEFHRAGFELVDLGWMGSEMVFSRVPVHTYAELQQLRLWRWDLDTTGTAMAHAMGLNNLPAPLTEASTLYDSGKIDGFFAIPMAALGFQWSTRAHYLLDLKAGQLEGCVVIASRAFDRLTTEQRQVLRGAAANLRRRWEQVSKAQEEALLDGLFHKQGLVIVPASESLRSVFYSEARAARGRLQARLVPPALLERVLALLADYRAEHPALEARP